MEGIRIAAALAALALGTGAPKEDTRMGAAPSAEHKMACKDGTYVDRNDNHACDNHGGPGAPPAAAEGPARKAQPPDLRAHDTPAHASPYSAFGAKRQARDTSKAGKRKAVVKCTDANDSNCDTNATSKSSKSAKSDADNDKPAKNTAASKSKKGQMSSPAIDNPPPPEMRPSPPADQSSNGK